MKRYLHIPVAAVIGAAVAATLIPREQIIMTEQPILQKVSDRFFEEMHAKELAFKLLDERSYRCFDYIMTKESNWRHEAKNKSSSAKGIGQLLDQTYKNLGMKHTNNPQAQVVAALAYIGRKYGSSGPCGAKRHWLKHGWY